MSVDPTKIDIDLDPTTQRMVGRAVHGNTPFDVPYISHIEDNLWTGGCMDGLMLPEPIEHLVSLYPWEQYIVQHALKSVLSVRMYDSLDVAAKQVDAVAHWVNACCADGPTLVHCQAGLNRSGLVAARALMLRGRTAQEAIDLLEVSSISRSALQRCLRAVAGASSMRRPTKRSFLGNWSAARWAWAILGMITYMCLVAAYVEWVMPS